MTSRLLSLLLRKGKGMYSEELSKKIQEQYLKGTGYPRMEKMFGIPRQNLRKHIDGLRRKGLLPTVKQNICRTSKEKSIKEIRDVWNDKAVYCDRKKANKCLFGTCATAANKCDYILITGHSRGCSDKECHRFIKGGAARKSGGLLKEYVEVWR